MKTKNYWGSEKAVWAGALALPCFLWGCASFEGRVAPHVSLNYIVDNLECELQEAYLYYQPKYPWLKDWASAFTLTMKREDKAGILPKIDYLHTGVFGLDVSGEVSGGLTKTLTTKRSVHLAYLDGYPCTPPPPGILQGRLGMIESLGEALDARDEGDKAVGEKPEDLGYTIEFALKMGVGASPSWVLTKVPSIGFGLAASQETTHTLLFAFVDDSPKGAKPGPLPERKAAKRVHKQSFGPRGVVVEHVVPARRQQRRQRQRQRTVSEETKVRLDAVFFRMQLQNLGRR